MMELDVSVNGILSFQNRLSSKKATKELFLLLDGEQTEDVIAELYDYAIRFPKEQKKVLDILDSYMSKHKNTEKSRIIKKTMDMIIASIVVDSLEG